MAKGKKSKGKSKSKPLHIRNPYALLARMRKAYKRINKRKQESRDACKKNRQNKITND